MTRADPGLDSVIAPDARLELLSDRFGITEGPAWVPDGGQGYILVSDLTANVIYRIAPRAGAMFFTDPDFGLRYGANSPLKQLDSAGIWYLKDGQLRKVLDERQLGGAPDGIALSPDEHSMYLSAGLHRIKRYTVASDGSLSGERLFAEGDGIGDGIKVDLAGNVYSASGTAPGIVRITAASGKLLGTLNLPIPAEEPKRYICASNLAFGGADGRTLIITACQAVYQIRLRSAGPVAEAH
jgi:gluconolactonase